MEQDSPRRRGGSSFPRNAAVTTDPSAKGKLAIGKLGAPKGVKGDIKVHSYSGESAHFLSLVEVDLVGGAKGRALKLKVLRIEEEGDGLIMAFEGYPSPEAVRALTGLEIVVSREKAAPLRENEWYVADLIGLSLVAGGGSLATVASVIEGGPDPWLEASLPGGRKALVPFRKEFVGEVDIEGRTIELLAPWLLDE